MNMMQTFLILASLVVFVLSRVVLGVFQVRAWSWSVGLIVATVKTVRASFTGWWTALTLTITQSSATHGNSECQFKVSEFFYPGIFQDFRSKVLWVNNSFKRIRPKTSSQRTTKQSWLMTDWLNDLSCSFSVFMESSGSVFLPLCSFLKFTAASWMCCLFVALRTRSERTRVSCGFKKVSYSFFYSFILFYFIFRPCVATRNTHAIGLKIKALHTCVFKPLPLSPVCSNWSDGPLSITWPT